MRAASRSARACSCSSSSGSSTWRRSASGERFNGAGATRATIGDGVGNIAHAPDPIRQNEAGDRSPGDLVAPGHPPHRLGSQPRDACHGAASRRRTARRTGASRARRSRAAPAGPSVTAPVRQRRLPRRRAAHPRSRADRARSRCRAADGRSHQAPGHARIGQTLAPAASCLRHLAEQPRHHLARQSALILMGLEQA